jgi:hypothetical protein
MNPFWQPPGKRRPKVRQWVRPGWVQVNNNREYHMKTSAPHLIALLLSVLTSSVAQGSVISVFSDVDMFSQTNYFVSGNQQVALNILGSGQSVFMSSKGGEDADALFNFYTSQSGIAVARSGNTLDSNLLTGVDLLVIDIGFHQLTIYDESETLAITQFLRNGGNVMLIAETHNEGFIPDNSRTPHYNALLRDIGSSISFESNVRCCGGGIADIILPTIITAGVSNFGKAGANNLLGGNAAIRDTNFGYGPVFTIAAYEIIPSAVPIPSAAWLFGSALGLMGVMRRRFVGKSERKSNPGKLNGCWEQNSLRYLSNSSCL